ncbi:MAG: TlpA family protein disulfide reductase [Thiohalomonadales bacterium]
MQNNILKNYYVYSLILFTALFNIVLADGLPSLTHNLTAIKSTTVAPNLRFQSLDHDIVDIKDLKGKVVIVNFWATWCPPCRREMGSLERLYQATKDNNVEVLAVNIGEDDETVFSFLGTIDPSPTFKILFDTDGESMSNWNVKGLPTTYIVNPDGIISYSAVGGREFDHPVILQKIKNMIK